MNTILKKKRECLASKQAGLWPRADFAGGAGTRRGLAGKESGN